MIMNPKSSTSSILQQIAQIQHMEQGKLCVLREGPDGPYYNIQCWEQGKNCCRYVPREQVPAVQKAIAGYQQFQELVEQYAQQVIEKTREEIAARSKKKTRRPNSSWPRTPKSTS
jgi:hypothetical protein